MSILNVTELFEGIVYQSMEDKDFNSSVFPDVDDYDTDNTLSESYNVTPLFLRNGTRTKAPYLTRARDTNTVAALFIMFSYYTCPIIVVIGILSNLLAYLIFTRTRLRKVPSVPYLAAMAVVDSGALLTEFIQKGVSLHGINIIVWSGVCQYTTYFSYIFIFLCIWYPVALCVEKFISVYFPLRKAALCTTFRAKIVVIGMLVTTGTCYYYVIYMTGPVYFGPTLICHVWDFFRKDFGNLMMLDYIFTVVVPSIVLSILMILICGRGCEYYRISSTGDVSNRIGGTRNSTTRAPIRVTNVIFPVVFFILTLKIPMGLLRLYGVINSTPKSQIVLDLQSVLFYLARFEWVIKLYIYLIFSPSFRRRTKSFLCSLRAKLKGRCVHELAEEEEMERMTANLPERTDRGGQHRAYLMSSDV